MSDRVPPHDLDAEVGVIGGVLLRNAAMADALARGVDSQAFYHPTHGAIFAGMEALYDAHQPIDPITLCDWLKSHRRGIAGVEAMLADSSARVPTAENIGYYARIVHDAAAVRRFIAAGTEAIGKAFAYEPRGEVEAFLHERTETLLATVAQRSRILEPRHLAALVAARYAPETPETTVALPTGLTRLDGAIGGLRKRRLLVIGGRTGHGKSTLAQIIIAHLASHGIPVGLFSLEEEGADYADAMVVRMARHIFGDRWGRFDAETRRQAYTGATGDYAKLPIHICEERRLSMRDIARKAREMKSRFGVQAIFVDYLGLVRRSGRRKEHEEIEDIIAEFNALSQAIDVAPVLVCQVNREAEKQVLRDPRPKIWQLQGAGAIEQCAWVVLLVYRGCVQDPKADGNVVEIIVGKNKRGRIGSTKHLWVADVPDIRDLPSDYCVDDESDRFPDRRAGLDQ